MRATPSARWKNLDLPSEGPQVPWPLAGDSRENGRLADLLLQRRVTAESTRALFVLKEVSLLLVCSSSSLSLSQAYIASPPLSKGRLGGDLVKVRDCYSKTTTPATCGVPHIPDTSPPTKQSSFILSLRQHDAGLLFLPKATRGDSPTLPPPIQGGGQDPPLCPHAPRRGPCRRALFH